MFDPLLVSIVIPCYNADMWLRAAIRSALDQTWRPIEVIVVDDGSTDQSLAIARGCEGGLVTVLSQKNRGASAARNAGLAAARGSYVQFLDADDLLAPDKIKRQMRIGAPLVSGEWARFRTDPSEAEFKPQPLWRNIPGVEFLQLHYEEGWMMHPAAWLISRDLAERIGPWDEQLSLNDDGEYFARAMLAAGEIAFCPGARSLYRSLERPSLSKRQDQDALKSLFRSTELTLGRLIDASQSERTRQAVAYGWKWLAYELYPRLPELSAEAERRCRACGGSARPLRVGGRIRFAAKWIGWKAAKRLMG